MKEEGAEALSDTAEDTARPEDEEDHDYQVVHRNITKRHENIVIFINDLQYDHLGLIYIEEKLSLSTLLQKF